MNIETVKESLPNFAKDIKLNLSVLDETVTTALNQKQIMIIALACAYTIQVKSLTDAILADAEGILSADEIEGAKAAATIMAMNNVYYRFIGTLEDSYGSLPVKLRMNVMANPGMDKITFELASMAVSALNGCGKCMKAHAAQLEKAEVSKEAIQSSVRIAAVLKAAGISLQI